MLHSHEIKITADTKQAERAYEQFSRKFKKPLKSGLDFPKQYDDMIKGNYFKELDKVNRMMQKPTIYDAYGRPMGGGMAGIGGAAGGVGGVGGAAGLAGAGRGALSKIGIRGAGVAGVAAAGVMRVFGGYGAYEQLAPHILRMQGMGAKLNWGAMGKGAALGYGPTETAQTMQGILTGTGKMNPALLQNIQEMSRGTGVGTDVLTRFSAIGTQAGGRGQNLVKQQAQVYADALATRLERGRIGEYLQTTASLMEETVGKYAGSSVTQISTLMSTLTRTGGAVTPQVSANAVRGFNQILQNPQGGMGMLMLRSMKQTLQQGGMNVTPEDLMMMTTSGLTPPSSLSELIQAAPGSAAANTSGFQYLSQLYGAYQGGGGALGTLRNFAQSTQQMGGGLRGKGIGVWSKKLGISPIAAEGLISNLTNPQFQMTDEESKDKLGKLMEGEKDNLTAIKDSLTGQGAVVKALNEMNQVRLGRELYPAITSIKESLLTIEGLVLPFVKLINFTPLGVPGLIKRYGTKAQKELSQITGGVGDDIADVGYFGAIKNFFKRGAYGMERAQSGGAGTFLGLGSGLSSQFGPRIPPTAGASSFHSGWDVKMGYGSPVSVPFQGRVSSVGPHSVGVKDPYGFDITFKHLSKVAVKQGDIVTPEQVLGLSGGAASGSEGPSTGPHLHTEVSRGGRLVNPSRYQGLWLSLGSGFGKDPAMWNGGTIRPDQLDSYLE